MPFCGLTVVVVVVCDSTGIPVNLNRVNSSHKCYSEFTSFPPPPMSSEELQNYTVSKRNALNASNKCDISAIMLTVWIGEWEVASAEHKDEGTDEGEGWYVPSINEEGWWCLTLSVCGNVWYVLTTTEIEAGLRTRYNHLQWGESFRGQTIHLFEHLLYRLWVKSQGLWSSFHGVHKHLSWSL